MIMTIYLLSTLLSGIKTTFNPWNSLGSQQGTVEHMGVGRIWPREIQKTWEFPKTSLLVLRPRNQILQYGYYANYAVLIIWLMFTQPVCQSEVQILYKDVHATL